MDFKLFWSEEAIRNLENILNYLIEKWSQREVDNFKSRLSRQLDLIVKNPRMFPVSEYIIKNPEKPRCGLITIAAGEIRS